MIFSHGSHWENRPEWWEAELYLHKVMKSFIIRFSETIFEESEDHAYEMEYEEPKNDGMHVKVQSNPSC